MQQDLKFETKPSAGGPTKTRSTIDRDLARLLSARVAEGHRLAFARSFASAIVETYWTVRQLASPRPTPPQAIERLALSGEAAVAAEQLGSGLAGRDPYAAAYLIGTIYATALPDAYRASHGIFYTPPELAEQLLVMAENAGVNWRTARVLDPACGGGAFLLPVAARMVAAMEGADPAFVVQQIGTRLRGFDVDPFGAWLAQTMFDYALEDLCKASGRAAPKIVETRDSLDIKPDDQATCDLVVGNPPYGRVSLPDERRRAFARSVYGHANLYGLFTDAALRWVKDGGVVAYVTPTSMLSGLYYRALRDLLGTEAPPLAVNFVSERDGVFADVLQETMLATYRRKGIARGGKVGFITIEAGGRASFRKVGTIALPTRPFAPWLLPRSPEQAALTHRLRAMPHRLADYGYSVSTGPLVWNRFKTQFRDVQEGETYPVIWAESVTSDGRFVWRSEKRNHAPWFKAGRPKDDWLIVDRSCVLVQRTTAKEQARRLIAAELPQSFVRKNKGVVVENHLNMVRPTNSNPKIPASVVAALLNSAAVDAAFRCINGSVAVSAFELEELPLPPPPLFEKLVRLVTSGAPTRKIEAAIAGAYVRANAAAAS